MSKKLAVLAIGLAMAVGASARADSVSTNVTLSGTYTGVGAVAGVGEVSSAQAGGLSYTTTTQPLTVPGGAVYATGANLLSTYAQVPSAGGGSANLAPGDKLILTYAIQGTQATAVGPGLSASFQKGVVAIYDIGTKAFSGANPATWGPTGGYGTLIYSSNIVVNPGNTTPGVSPQGQPSSSTPGATQNFAAFNPAVGTSTAGNFVFQDLVNNFYNSLFPSNGIQIHISETNATTAQSPGDAPLDANFAAVAALDPTTVFGTTSPFSATNYSAIVNLQPSGNAAGDTIQTIAFDTFPILLPTVTPPGPGVPEPTSMLLWAGVAVGFGIYRRTRRSVKKA